MSGGKGGIQARTAYMGFAAFGVFWGVWGASVPAIRAQAELSDGQLGTALLFVGAGALPAMLVTGRAVDRWGLRVAALLLVTLGAVGTLVAVAGRDFWSLSAGLALLGASSGAADVAINSAAASAERASGRPVITRAHGTFSTMVVVGSLSAGLLLGGLGVPVVVPFLLVAGAAVGAAFSVVADWRAASAAPVTDGTVPGQAGAVSVMEGTVPDPVRATPVADGTVPYPAGAASVTEETGPVAAGAARDGGRRGYPGYAVRLFPLLVVGGLGALAFAVENAHQSWGAVYLADVAGAGPALASAGPAVFAAVVALTRFAAGAVGSRHAATVLVCGAVTAAAGTTLVSVATAVPVVLLGLALAAVGTAVLFPMLMGVVAAHVGEAARGRATSVVTTVAYLGFLAGPVYVGRWAETTGLPGAMVAVAALAAALAVLTWPSLRSAVGTGSPWDSLPASGRAEDVAGRAR
ncbi:MFS transporter [Streptosporangium sp. NBC_01469]|uniref:MFS transporter n=1 Tax=Streptosporangium sp. NBC_01469 TaxID=2903898 RepID=UPI002E2E7388|nr:MFS transporter [Streptosporangium sp. NBC_01469]